MGIAWNIHETKRRCDFEVHVSCEMLSEEVFEMSRGSSREGRLQNRTDLNVKAFLLLTAVISVNYFHIHTDPTEHHWLAGWTVSPGERWTTQLWNVLRIYKLILHCRVVNTSYRREDGVVGFSQGLLPLNGSFWRVFPEKSEGWSGSY